MIRRPHARSGFTLLEVLLASAISLILLGGLYVAFDLALVSNDIAREEAYRSDLIRAVVNRMHSDLTAPISPLPPKSGGGASGAVGGGTTATEMTEVTETTTTTAPTGGSGPGPAAPSSSTITDSFSSSATAGDAGTAPAAAEIVNLPFQSGVIGTNTQLTLFVSKVPQALLDAGAMASGADAGVPADLRRVTYYQGSGGGLCRQDRPWVLADEIGGTADPDTSTEESDLLTSEVTAVTFEYFDGADWLTEWNGTQAGSDGSPVSGPPRAIRVTLTFEFPERGRTATKQVIQVYPVRAANGMSFTPVENTGETTDAAATGGM